MQRKSTKHSARNWSCWRVVLLNPLVPFEYIYRHQHKQHKAVEGGYMDKSPQLICGARGRACARRAHPRDRRWSRYLAAKLIFSEAVKYWTIVDPNPVTTFAIPYLKIEGLCRGPRQAPARGRLCCALAHARAHLRPGSDGP